MLHPARPPHLAALLRLAALDGVPLPLLLTVAAASTAAGLMATLGGWPLWAAGLAVVGPWLAVVARGTAWTFRHDGWLALFYVLVITQLGHVGEHVAQVVQLHVLGRTGTEARGVVGQLDIEWVHFLFNASILLAVALLVTRFPRNGWLWLTLAIAGWHALEHTVMLSVYLRTGVPGDPGFLAQGGRLFGGLPLRRPDLHFGLNVVETIPLLIAFVVQVRALDRADRGVPAAAHP